MIRTRSSAHRTAVFRRQERDLHAKGTRSLADDGVHETVVGLGGEVGEELERPAKAEEIGGRLTPQPP